MRFIKTLDRIHDYSIIVTFNNYEQRRINFGSMLNDFPALSDLFTFNKVCLNQYSTLEWDGLAKLKMLSGELVSVPLDFSADTLYEMSENL